MGFTKGFGAFYEEFLRGNFEKLPDKAQGFGLSSF